MELKQSTQTANEDRSHTNLLLFISRGGSNNAVNFTAGWMSE